MHKLLRNKEKLKELLYDMYVLKEMSSCMIAEKLEVNYEKIWYWLKLYNILNNVLKLFWNVKINAKRLFI